MSEIIAIAIGGALGALARFWSNNAINQLMGVDYPYGILIVNVLGSILIGVAFVILVEKTHFDEYWRSFIMVGVLGAFTTFSTFSLQTLGLIEAGRLFSAISYALASVVLCIAGVAIGVFVTRMLN
jgi:fluoride exporter